MNLRDLYQDVILDHNSHPRNFHPLKDACCQAEGFNPLCGDKLNLFLKMENDIITDASFVGQGCAISTASASLMTESLKGKTKAQAKNLFASVHHMLTSQEDNQDPHLGKLSVLSGVKAYPARVKCATLAWHTLLAALKNIKETACTE